MTVAENVQTQPLSFLEELMLMLLNEENGYFYQVPGWNLNCAVAGAVLAELSLRFRIDTDRDSLFLINDEETGRPTLDPTLKEIAAEKTPRSTQYWVERIAPKAESLIDITLDRLVEMGILQHHDGEFWTLARNAWKTEVFDNSSHGGERFVRTRISRAIFENETPDPKDALIISLINTCDVLRFMFQLDEDAEKRIDFICNLDLIGQSIATAVSNNLAGPLLRHSALRKKIPRVALRKMAFNRNLRKGNVPAMLADLAREYGPVFEVRPPFARPMIFLAGPETNRWTHRSGRMYLRAQTYFSEFESVYGAHGVLPSLDGADHFRLRKSLSPAYSRGRLAGQLDAVYRYGREYMSAWNVGENLPATRMSRLMINSQLSPLFISVDSQDIIDDLIKYKERALMTHIIRALPKFMLSTPGMKRRAKRVDTLLERVQNVHTTAQRAGADRDLVDDLLSLHASEPQLVPESNLRFAISAALIASVYLGDAFSFALYAMASNPELHAKIQSEADALFENGDPKGEDFTLSSMEVTHRFLMECLRIYPIVPVSMRDVMNTCIVEGYEIPVGSRVVIAQTATHFMEDVFPEPFKFDIDRYLPSRSEHTSPGYAPYGLGTHKCLGSRWMELHLAVNVLMVAHYFNIEVFPSTYKLRFNPLPSMKPSRDLRFRIAEQRRDLGV